MKQIRRLLCTLLALCLLLSLAACGKAPATNGKPNTGAQAGSSGKPSEALSSEPIHAAKDYDEVKAQFLSAANATPAMGTAEVFNGFDGLAAEAETEAPAMAAEDYSDTNIQVEGVDEADVVKTDGRNIYALFGSVLQIFRADGENTGLLSELYLGSEDDETYTEPFELYTDGSCLIVLTHKTEQTSDWMWKELTEILFYDAADPAEPKLITTFAQDGYYQTSRLTDGTLYLVTQQYLYEDPDEGKDWIPRTYCNGKDSILPAEDIYLCPDCHDTAFTLVGAYDSTGAELSDVCSFTGCCDNVYMSRDNLYLAQYSSEMLASEPYSEDQYTVTDYESVSATRIHRIAAQDGKLTPTGTGTVNGQLHNQFSMDEYDGMLRLAVTTSSYSYKIYKDEKYGFENYAEQDSATNNAVIVLDSQMEQLGIADDLVEDEQIYSVRFIGETAYVVTYESIDPVFTIDLSDPTKPTVQSALELTGVSNYLQSYGDGLLFGFGEALDENAASSGLQLNMFDVSDAKNVKLLAKTVIEDYGSEAIYNHKALIVEPEKNLIMFPGGDATYYVYSYEDGKFTERGCFEIGTENERHYWYWQHSRGLYIGDYLYLLCDQVVFVVDMNTFETVRELSFAEG